MFDDEIVNMGSLNLDSYSWYGNNELNIEVESNHNLISQFQTEFDNMLSQSIKITHQREQKLPELCIQKLFDFNLMMVEKLMFHRNFYQ